MYQLLPPFEDLFFVLVLLSFHGMAFKFGEGFLQDVNIMLMNDNPADGWCTIAPVSFKA